MNSVRIVPFLHRYRQHSFFMQMPIWGYERQNFYKKIQLEVGVAE